MELEEGFVPQAVRERLSKSASELGFGHWETDGSFDDWEMAFIKHCVVHHRRTVRRNRRWYLRKGFRQGSLDRFLLLAYGPPSMGWKLSTLIVVHMMALFSLLFFIYRGALIEGIVTGAVIFSIGLVILLLPEREAEPDRGKYVMLREFPPESL